MKGTAQQIGIVVAALAVFAFVVGTLDQAGLFPSIIRPIKRGFGG